MQKILVTGANGFVGYYLVKELLEKKYEVIATGKGNCRLPFYSSWFQYRSMDFTVRQEVDDLFSAIQPGIVIHCGAVSKPDECETDRASAHNINVTGTTNLLKASGTQKSKFIFLSTDFVFDGKKGMYEEDDKTGPVNYYGETKVMAEKYVREYDHEWAIVRTVLVYGKPFLSRQNLLTNTADHLRKQLPLKIFDDQVRTPTYVEDLARAICSIIELNANGIFHISGEDIITPYEMSIAVAEHLGLDKTLISKIKEGDLHQPARRPLKTGFNISKAKRELSFVPTPFAAGLRKTFE